MKRSLSLLLSLAMLEFGSGTAVTQTPGPEGAALAPAAEVIADLPILGLAAVTFRVSDLARSRLFYHHVLGLPEAFDLRDRSGQVTAAWFKVNDDQFVELRPGLAAADDNREARLVIQVSDLTRLHAIYRQRGLAPGPITNGPDGNPVFRIVAPNGLPLDFLEYAPGSRQGRLRGRLLAPERIATHLLHAGTMVRDDATKRFFQRLGWGRTLPGPRGDYIETPITDRNLETKNPPLDPDDPATQARYAREVSGAVNHLSLEIDDMHAAREMLKQRGGYDDVRLRVAVGNNRHWLLHLFDPDGSRIEFMSKATVPDGVPAFSVMPPGPPAPPILATQRGVYPWP